MSDPAIDELWAKVSASWDDEKAHAAFLELCRLRGQLPEAAARAGAPVVRLWGSLKRTGDAAEVARYSIDESERGRFLLLPHKDTRSRWLLKRWAPGLYFKAVLSYVAKNSRKAG